MISEDIQKAKFLQNYKFDLFYQLSVTEKKSLDNCSIDPGSLRIYNPNSGLLIMTD